MILGFRREADEIYAVLGYNADLSVCLYIYCVCVCVYMYIYIYIFFLAV